MNARQKITEAMDAFNAEMGQAGERFNRLMTAQEFLLHAVEAAESYARGEAALPAVVIPDDGQMAPEPQPRAFEEPVTDLPRYLQRDDPPPIRSQHPDTKMTEFAWGEEVMGR